MAAEIDVAEIDVAEVCFAARALAQSHPMTPVALAYLRRRLESERSRQPVGEPADWAGAAMVVGYCLRRTEENRVARPPVLRDTDAVDLERAAVALAGGLRDGDAGEVTLLPASVTVAALDRLIGTELDKRREHLREQLDDAAWAELSEYLAWWVVHGYCIRAAEAPGS